MQLEPKELSPIIYSACETIGISVHEAFRLINSSGKMSELNKIDIHMWIRFCNLVFIPYEFFYHGYSKDIHIMELKKNPQRVLNSKLPQTAELKKILGMIE